MFDPYHKWLGIPKDQRPPTFYQLLGIAIDEQDLEVIEEAAIRQTAHVRGYQIGPHAAECTRLLNEIAQARQTLLNPAKRKEYDAKLAAGRKGPADSPRVAVSAGAPVGASVFAGLGQDPEAPPAAAASDDRLRMIKRPSRAWLLPAIVIGAVVVALGGAATAFMVLLSPPEAPRPPAAGGAQKKQPAEAAPQAREKPIAAEAKVPPPMIDRPMPAAKLVPAPPPVQRVPGAVVEIPLLAEVNAEKIMGPGYQRFVIALDGSKVLYAQPGQLVTRSADDWHKPVTHPVHHHGIMALSRDGSRVLLQRGSQLVLWNWQLATEEKTYGGFKANANNAALSADNKWVAAVAAGNSGTFALWDRQTGQLVRQRTPQPAWGGDIAFSEDGTRLFAFVHDHPNREGYLSVHHIAEDRTETHKFDRVVTADLSPDGSYLATRSHDGELRLFDLTALKVVHARKGDNAIGLRFSRDGRYLAMAVTRGGLKQMRVVIMDPKSSTIIGETPRADGAFMHSLAVATNGAAAAAYEDGMLRLWRPLRHEVPAKAEATALPQQR
jgi:hypothetical protein